VGGGVGVGVGMIGLVCSMKAFAVLLGVRGIITQTMGGDKGEEHAEKTKGNKK